MKKADLHIHTEASDDSILKPEEIFQLARDAGLYAVAFTDHDGLRNIDAGLKLSRKYGIHFLPGIELTCSWRNQLAHLLGYFPAGVSTELDDLIETKIRGGTRKVAEILISRMARNGIEVTWQEYLAEIASGGKHGSPLCRLLINKGIVRDAGDYTQRFNTPEYKVDDCFYPPITEVIPCVKQLGGFAVVAHPGSKGRYGLCDLRLEDIARFAQSGLDGVEVYHPMHSDRDIAEYAQIADRLDLVKTGGSDSHGRQLAEERVVGVSFCDWTEVEQMFPKQAQ